jgi:hypothetical protein
MCLSCSCHRPVDTHQDDRHITLDDLKAAADAAGITPLQAAQNILNEVRRINQRMSVAPFVTRETTLTVTPNDHTEHP